MRNRLRIEAAAGFGLSAALLAAGAVLVAAAASASAAPPTGGALHLVATPGVLADSAMQPGDTIYWPIDANVTASTGGHLTLKIESADTLATDTSGLRLALASCPVAWDTTPEPALPPTCIGGAGTPVISETAFANISPTHVWDLGNVASVSTTPLMATISLPASVPSALQGASATINFGFTALGDTADVSPTVPSVPVLGLTGVDPTGPIVLAVGLLLGGVTLARVRSAPSRRQNATEASA